MALTASELSQRGRMASHSFWASCADRSAATAPARRGFEDRFLDKVDPERKLPPAERAIRAEHARKAYFAGLALRSAQSRRKAREATAAADAADAELRDAG